MKPIIFIALLGFCLLGAATGQEKTDKPASKPKIDVTVTAEREAAVMTFVEKNHAELKDLLTYLKDNRRKDYERAIRELSRDAERIGQLKERDGKQYDLEIKAWTIRSRIQLLTAHLAMGDKEEIRDQLRGLLNEQMDVRAELLKRERERAQERLTRIEQDLNRLDNQRQKMVENQLQMLTKSAADSKNRAKGAKYGPRPGAKKPVKPTVTQPDK